MKKVMLEINSSEDNVDYIQDMLVEFHIKNYFNIKHSRHINYFNSSC